MVIVFDLDGTLANIEHRLHYIKDGRKDWPGFYRACVDDKPHYPVVATYAALRDTGQHSIQIWSGRSDEVRYQTAEWLNNHAWGYSRLRMRREGDYTPDNVLKAAWMEEHLADYGSYPALAFDDRQRVVDEWRKRGTICCQVGEGDF